MASSSTAPTPVGPDTLITIKINAQGVPRKLKLPLKDLVPTVLPFKLRGFLGVFENQVVVFERFSDSSASYVNLDPNNLHAYKTLYRAAKAKLKLRLRAHIGPVPNAVPALIATPNIEQLVNNNFQDTLRSLANLNIETDAAVAKKVITSAQAAVESSTQSSQAPTAVPETPDSTAHEPIATAIASFASQSSTAFPTSQSHLVNIPVHSVADAKSADFSKKVREIDDQLALKIGAHRSRLFASEKFGLPTSSESVAKDSFKTHPTFQPSKSGCPGLRMSNPPKLPDGATYSWSVYCNQCNKNMLDEHYHCNSCDNGDYDLCVDCMEKGKHCLDENHWLIKRLLLDGKVVNATTQKHCFASSPKVKSHLSLSSMPGAFTDDKKLEEVKKPTRTCNCCVKVFEEDAFVTCEVCDDYDLCVPCLEFGKHGHHPAHNFSPATDLTSLTPHTQTLCNPGRNISHAAVCDECDTRIVGVRHKCLICPDFDYCSTCIRKAPAIHRGHRFAPIYDSIAPQTCSWSPTHVGVYCDGPICKNKSAYIAGVRYKCAVCPDLDFCANCEALPHLEHNRTHPLLKFRTPVRGCNVTTMVGEDNVRPVQTEQASKTQIQTVAEVKPTECASKFVKEKIEIKDLLLEPTVAKPASPLSRMSLREPVVSSEQELEALFVRDTITDGTTFEPEAQFVQVWTLTNPGPETWPAGCSVRYVGGDNMLNVNDVSPSSESDIAKATESNTIRRAVQAGEEISFRVLMRAPKRKGVAISYWRLKTADGIPFGHRLWCHINVAGQTVTDKKTDDREVGRLGSQDAFLRYSLTNQFKREEVTGSDAISEKLMTLRNALKEHSAPNGSTLREIGVSGNDKVEKVKIEVVESTEKASEKPSQLLSFPVLDMQSSSSTITTEQIATNAAAPENLLAVAPVLAPAVNDAKMFDDAESIDLLDDSSSDDGFLTEDEYDILDASDEELV